MTATLSWAAPTSTSFPPRRPQRPAGRARRVGRGGAPVVTVLLNFAGGADANTFYPMQGAPVVLNVPESYPDEVVIFPTSFSASDLEALRLREAARKQAEWFCAHKSQLSPEYADRFVAVHGEQVVDSDTDLPELVDRFFLAHGRVGVYFGFVGERRPTILAAVV